jgi:hypothetical protein
MILVTRIVDPERRQRIEQAVKDLLATLRFVDAPSIRDESLPIEYVYDSSLKG